LRIANEVSGGKKPELFIMLVAKSLIDETDYEYLPHVNIEKSQGLFGGVRKYSTQSPSDYERTIKRFTSLRCTPVITLKRLSVKRSP
jgi:hypothetical protein